MIRYCTEICIWYWETWRCTINAFSINKLQVHILSQVHESKNMNIFKHVGQVICRTSGMFKGLTAHLQGSQALNTNFIYDFMTFFAHILWLFMPFLWLFHGFCGLILVAGTVQVIMNHNIPYSLQISPGFNFRLLGGKINCIGGRKLKGRKLKGAKIWGRRNLKGLKYCWKLTHWLRCCYNYKVMTKYYIYT